MTDPREALLSRFRASLLVRTRGLRALLDDLEQRPADADVARQVAGELHTLKGEARMLGMVALSKLAHALEGELARVEGTDVAAIIRAVDAIRDALDPNTPLEIAEAVFEANVIELDRERTQAPHADPRELPPPAQERPVEAEAAPPPAGSSARWVQVDANLIDQLCESLAGLSADMGKLLAQSAVALAGAPRRAAQGEWLEDLTRCRLLADDCTVKAWSLRLVPVEPALRELAHHARALGDKLGKPLRTNARADGVQIERDVLEQLWDSLLHLVRNAVDHGLEGAAERGAKPPVGQLDLTARAMGASVVIEVRDDGRGIDSDAVLRAAVERGLIDPAAAPAMTREETLRLLFEHGFSTRQSVGELSGRGVGLDVVRRRVEGLGGKVYLQSEPGEGARFSLAVPFTITKERLLVVELAGALYGFPARAITSVLRSGTDAPHGGVLRYEGEALPLRSLANALGRETPDSEHYVLVADLGQRYALAVPHVLGQRELIRRPAEPLLAKTTGVAASAMLDDGRVVLLLDLDFVRRCLDRSPEVAPLAGRARPEIAKRHVLVVDDSPVVREMVKEILLSAGIAVEVASDGRAGLRAFEAREPAMLLSDVEMPHMNGFELLAEVRRRTQRVPVVMLTTRGSLEDRQRAASLGANAYLLKSDFQSDALLEVVNRFFRVGS